MEISARVLREVEFNSSLRGYNTDEVDEFLEQVADAVDRLQEEAKSAAERAEAAERGARDRTGLEDDDSIRRTLVLAQRTADLAIREAQEEATQMLERARSEAELLVTDARESATRITSEAERRLRDEVARLGGARDELRKEVDTLVSLLGTERERLTETLGAAMKYVERSLSPSADLMSLAPSGGRGGSDAPATEAEPEGEEAEAPSPAAGDGGEVTTSVAAADTQAPTSETPVATPEPAETEPGGSEAAAVDDLEAAIAEDAAAAAPAYARESEPEHYDWDSVIRGQSEPLFPDEKRLERPNLTALPSSEESAKDTAAAKSPSRGADWSA